MQSEDYPFCSLPEERILVRNELVIAVRDGFPDTEGHTLIIPTRHVSSFFDLAKPESCAVLELVKAIQQQISKEDESVTGFNVGINIGASAGQTIFHCHIHLIPRRDGDVDDPRGGIRHVIPGKGYY